MREQVGKKGRKETVNKEERKRVSGIGIKEVGGERMNNSKMQMGKNVSE